MNPRPDPTPAAALPFSEDESQALGRLMGALRDPALRSAALLEGRLSPQAVQVFQALEDGDLREPGGVPEAERQRELRRRLLERYPLVVPAFRSATGRGAAASQLPITVVTINIPSNAVIFGSALLETDWG